MPITKIDFLVYSYRSLSNCSCLPKQRWQAYFVRSPDFVKFCVTPSGIKHNPESPAGNQGLWPVGSSCGEGLRHHADDGGEVTQARRHVGPGPVDSRMLTDDGSQVTDGFATKDKKPSGKYAFDEVRLDRRRTPAGTAASPVNGRYG